MRLRKGLARWPPGHLANRPIEVAPAAYGARRKMDTVRVPCPTPPAAGIDAAQVKSGPRVTARGRRLSGDGRGDAGSAQFASTRTAASESQTLMLAASAPGHGCSLTTVHIVCCLQEPSSLHGRPTPARNMGGDVAPWQLRGACQRTSEP